MAQLVACWLAVPEIQIQIPSRQISRNKLVGTNFLKCTPYCCLRLWKKIWNSRCVNFYWYSGLVLTGLVSGLKRSPNKLKSIFQIQGLTVTPRSFVPLVCYCYLLPFTTEFTFWLITSLFYFPRKWKCFRKLITLLFWHQKVFVSLIFSATSYPQTCGELFKLKIHFLFIFLNYFNLKDECLVTQEWSHFCMCVFFIVDNLHQTI